MAGLLSCTCARSPGICTAFWYPMIHAKAPAPAQCRCRHETLLHHVTATICDSGWLLRRKAAAPPKNRPQIGEKSRPRLHIFGAYMAGKEVFFKSILLRFGKLPEQVLFNRISLFCFGMIHHRYSTSFGRRGVPPYPVVIVALVR